MTDSENSQPQEDSDDDIYKDIPEFDFEDELAKLEGSKETYKQEANDLSEKVKTLTEENVELKKSNEVLKKNLSTLLKTAQAEVQRKDSMIEELRGKVESFTFRRNKPVTIDKCTSTYDLEISVETKCESEKEKTVGDKKKSKSCDNRTSSDNERKFSQEEKKKEFLSGKEEIIDCDSNNRKSGHCRENSKNFRRSDNSHDIYNERSKERKPIRFEDNSGYRRSYRENYRDHLKYDSFDKKRHSRSSEDRFISSRRHLRERRVERRRDDSFDRRRRRSGESSERSRSSRKDRSRSRDISRRSKESSLEKQKNRSLDIDSVKNKDQVILKSEISDCFKNNTESVESKTRILEGNEITAHSRNKQIKEKGPGKSEKRSNLDIFSVKSPLDALYNDMISSRNTSNLLKSKLGSNLPESDPEDGELAFSQTINEPEIQPKEDWTLSFKNERPNETKPMTLYSRRMLRKYSSEMKVTEKVESKKEKVSQEEDYKRNESEKEPGELTDDEQIVESSKEFQELARVASIDSELTEKPEKEGAFKEPNRRESYKTENLKTDSVVKECKTEIEKPATGKEELSVFKETEQNKNTHEVIEFSPFKSNYKLIEISPVKGSDEEHVLDFYNRRVLPTQISQKCSGSWPEEKISAEKNSSKSLDVSEEKESWKNSSSEKESETELKIIIPFENESPKKQEKKQENEKDSRVKNEKRDVKKRKRSKEVDKKKQKLSSKKQTEKPETTTADVKNRKRKRNFSDTYEESSNPKKKKAEKIEPSRKSTRSKRNSKSESESNSNKSEPKPVQDVEVDVVKEDISSFEFFKPVAKIDTKPESPINFVESDKSVCTTTDYKMTATMSVSGVVRLETPNKCVEKLKNLVINEQMIFNILDSSKNNSQFSPLVGSKCIEMTPRRILKNDLMLTDSEDDSISKKIIEREDEGVEQEEMDEGKGEISGSEDSECDSDSGASDFVDLL